MKYYYEDRLRVVKMYESGMTYTEIIKQLKVPKPDFIVWVHRYQEYGEEGLINLPYAKLSFKEKCTIVREHLVESVSLTDLRVKYGIGKTTINRWCRIVESQGYKALNDLHKRGRRPKDMGRPKKKKPEEMTELEMLRYENERLRAENALLKKVRALVEEREARLCEIGQKPSKN